MDESPRRELIPLDRAQAIAEGVVWELAPFCERIQIAGSIRRKKPEVKDVEIVAEPAKYSAGLFGEERYALDEIRQVCEKLGRVRKGGERYIQFELREAVEEMAVVDLFLVHPPAEWGVIFPIRTGPAEFSELAVTRIKGRLWRCENGWVRDERGRRVPCPEEADFFAAAEIPILEPEDREAWAKATWKGV